MADFPIERFEEIKAYPQRFRLIEDIPIVDEAQLSLPYTFNEVQATDGSKQHIIFLDLETTGLDPEKDKIIEIGMVKLTYDKACDSLLTIESLFQQYEDPQQPIPDFITTITGITDDMVQGQRIYDNEVVQFIQGENAETPLIVAHNAAFDRAFFDNRFAQLSDLYWGCTIAGVDWSSLGFESAKLEYVLMKLGWQYKGHRATTDVLAMAWLLYQMPQSFAMLLENSRATTWQVAAYQAPYDYKDMLKARGYKWTQVGSSNRQWVIEVSEEQLEHELQYLYTLYDSTQELVQVKKLTAKERFKHA